MRRAAAVLILGVVIALTAQFALDGWAGESDLNHWVQHGLLFWSGVAVGCAVIHLYLAGRRR